MLSSIYILLGGAKLKWIKKPLADKDFSSAEKSKTETIVKDIIEKVKTKGDQALLEMTAKFDQVNLDTVKVNKSAIKAAYQNVDKDTVNTVACAAENIKRFASEQLSTLRPLEFESMPGVTLGHRLVPVESVGCYVPAGRYPLPSSALMSIIPAKVAGVKRVAACAPPSKKYNNIHPLVLVAMDMAGVDEVYTMGGAQAIAAYKYGTESIEPTNMVVGPGNKFVVEAKRQLGGEIGLDLLAGPSEVLIIADKFTDCKKVVIDLIAKCEHDPEAVSILVTDDEDLGMQVREEIEKEINNIETAEVAKKSWDNYGEIIIAEDLDEAIRIANEKAPEHLQIMLENEEDYVSSRLYNFGSLFIGDCSPVAFGDYCSGPNHTLPTSRCARFTGGLWVGSFIKVLSYQKINAVGASKLAETCSPLAENEGLFAHKRSSDLRK